MRVVLTHSGSAVPDYTKYCIKQIRYTNPTVQIDLLVKYRFISEFRRKVRSVPDLNIYPLEMYHENPLWQEFNRLSWYGNWGAPNTVYPSPQGFVQGTSERLFVLLAYMKHNNWKNVWHFENDNLIYGSLQSLYPLSDKMTVCYMNDKHIVMNAIHIPSYEQLEDSLAWYVNEMRLGDQALKDKYIIDMTHEMTVMRHYPHFAYFPSIPKLDVKIADYYFDPASYGQHIAGTNNGHPPGFLDTVNHDIARQYGTRWHGISFEKKEGPKVIDTDNVEHKLFNLHMHNKHAIGHYISYERTNDDL